MPEDQPLLVPHVRDGIVGAEECQELIWLAKCMEAGSYRPNVTSATLPLIAQTQPELLVLTLAVRGALRDTHQRLSGMLSRCLLSPIPESSRRWR
jgi:hypothetical protein